MKRVSYWIVNIVIYLSIIWFLPGDKSHNYFVAFVTSFLLLAFKVFLHRLIKVSLGITILTSFILLLFAFQVGEPGISVFASLTYWLVSMYLVIHKEKIQQQLALIRGKGN